MNPDDSPRIGLGIDLHRLAPGRPCVIGGIPIESKVGPVGHSDGDVVLHAVCDAVLGAAGLDDLGTLFPDTDAAHAGQDSTTFCAEVMQQLATKNLRAISLDVVIECERPKIAPHRTAIRTRVATLFDLPLDRVNVRGKTGEGLDSIGRGEAIRATAVALITTRTTNSG